MTYWCRGCSCRNCNRRGIAESLQIFEWVSDQMVHVVISWFPSLDRSLSRSSEVIALYRHLLGLAWLTSRAKTAIFAALAIYHFHDYRLDHVVPLRWVADLLEARPEAAAKSTWALLCKGYPCLASLFNAYCYVVDLGSDLIGYVSVFSVMFEF